MTTTSDYRITVRIDAPSDAVFDAVTGTDELAAWWSPVDGVGPGRRGPAVPDGGGPPSPPHPCGRGDASDDRPVDA